MKNLNRNRLMGFRAYDEGDPVGGGPAAGAATPAEPVNEPPAIVQQRQHIKKLEGDIAARDAELKAFKESQLSEQEKVARRAEELAERVKSLEPLQEKVAKFEERFKGEYDALLATIPEDKREAAANMTAVGDYSDRLPMLKGLMTFAGSQVVNPEPNRPGPAPIVPGNSGIKVNANDIKGGNVKNVIDAVLAGQKAS